MFKLALIALCSVFMSGAKWPPWLSIESPVNPYDSATRGAVLLVHAQFRDGDTKLSDITGSAEGLVNGVRRSIPLRFDSTSRLNYFGVRRQWPSDGTWILRISLGTTTALVTFDRNGNVASSVVPTVVTSGVPLPRALASRELDSTLTAASRR